MARIDHDEIREGQTVWVQWENSETVSGPYEVILPPTRTAFGANMTLRREDGTPLVIDTETDSFYGELLVFTTDPSAGPT